MTRTIDQMIAREVLCCMSSIVGTLAPAAYHSPQSSAEELMRQAMELSAPIPDYEEAAIQVGWKWDEGGPHFYRTAPGASAFAPYEYERIDAIGEQRQGNWQALCEKQDIEPYDREVFEHWAVSDWLADRLIAQGEKVDKDFGALCVWARTTSGQGIAADGVIERIYNESHGPFPHRTRHGEWVLVARYDSAADVTTWINVDGIDAGGFSIFPTEAAAHSAALDILLGRTESGSPADWTGSPDPSDPDNYWIDDATGERVNATTGERTKGTPDYEALARAAGWSPDANHIWRHTPPINWTDGSGELCYDTLDELIEFQRLTTEPAPDSVG